MQVKLKDNEIFSIANIHDIERLSIGLDHGKFIELSILMRNGGRFITQSPDLYTYCLQRMTELNVFIQIDYYMAFENRPNIPRQV